MKLFTIILQQRRSWKILNLWANRMLSRGGINACLSLRSARQIISHIHTILYSFPTYRKASIRRDVLRDTTEKYMKLYGKSDGIRGAGQTVPASFEIHYFIGWKPDANTKRPLQRGSANTSLKNVLERSQN